MFPVWKVDSPSRLIEFVSYDQEGWFLADRERLYECFRTRVPFLGFTVNELEQLEDLIEALGLSERKLSAQVSEKRVH